MLYLNSAEKHQLPWTLNNNNTCPWSLINI